MTIHRDGWNGPITFECDGCGELLETGEEDFAEARATLKRHSWVTRKLGEDWINCCDFKCLREAKEALR